MVQELSGNRGQLPLRHGSDLWKWQLLWRSLHYRHLVTMVDTISDLSSIRYLHC